MASISDLLGSTRSTSDIELIPRKIRYTQSATIGSGRIFEFVLPKIGQDCLSLRNGDLKLKFNLNLSGLQGTGTYETFDATSIKCIFSRLRVISGSTTLMDINDLSTLLVLEERVNSRSSDNAYSRYLVGNDSVVNRSAYPNSREYITSFAPIGSLLCGDHCLPLSKMNDFRIELTLASADEALTSDVANPTVDYSISSVELMTNYLRSQSLSNYFAANPVSFHVTNFSHRYSTLLAQTELLRLSSAVSSLDSIITLFRNQSLLNGGRTSQGKFSTTDNIVASSNVYINSILFREVDVSSTEEEYENFASVYPHIRNSDNFENYATNEFVLGNRFSAAPKTFDKHLVSGRRSSAMNSDIAIKLQLTGVPTNAIVATSYMISTTLISLDGSGRGDLKITF
jgi:hypothetical protein